MKSRTLLWMAAAALCPIMPTVQGADAPAVTPPAASNAWIQINDNLGFVVEGERPARASLHQLPAVDGYFLVRRNGTWYVLEAHVARSMLTTSASR